MVSHVSFISIPAVDPERARDFYAQKLGLSVLKDAPYGRQRWIMMGIDGARTAIHFTPVSTMPETSLPALPLVAPDVVATIEKLRQAGVEVVREPAPAEWDPTTLYAMIRDCEGNLVLIASR